MKKSILTMAAIALIALTGSTSYGQSVDKKSEKAREKILESKKDVIDAKHDLTEAQNDSIADYQTFKKESETKIMNNEKSITELKGKVLNADIKDKAEYEKKLGVLEQKNVTLKKSLLDYSFEGRATWSTFKAGFNTEMEKLENELKNFIEDNKK